MRGLGIIAALLLGVGVAVAQGTDEAVDSVETQAAEPADELTPAQSNSRIVRFLEDTISSPTRQIRLQGVDGVLSSNGRIEAITVSDEQGVWLRIDNILMDWNRLALLRGRLNINEFSAERITMLRKPLPDPDAVPDPEAKPFALPDLPVAINIGSLKAGEIDIGEQVIGRPAALSLDGNLTLANGDLSTDLDIVEMGTGSGRLDLRLDYVGESRDVDMDLLLSEGPDGILVSLLDVERRPAIRLRLAGAGPLDDLDLDLSLDARATRVVDGLISLRGDESGLSFDADILAQLEMLTPPELDPFFRGRTALSTAGVLPTGGGIILTEADLRTAAMTLSAALATSPDWFPEQIALSADISQGNGQPVVLPFANGASVADITLEAALGSADGPGWEAALTVTDLRSEAVSIGAAELVGFGEAENLSSPGTRALSFDVEGRVDGIDTGSVAINETVSEGIDLIARGRWASGAPVVFSEAQLLGAGSVIALAGEMFEGLFTGALQARVPDMETLAPLTGMALDGALDLGLSGTVTPLSGAFDLALDGTGSNLATGIAQADAVLAGETKLSGQAVRDETGLRIDGLTLENPQLTANGEAALASTGISATLDAGLSDLALVAGTAVTGAADLSIDLAGSEGPKPLAVQVLVTEGTVVGQPLSALKLDFEGTLDGAALAGDISGDAALAGEAVTLAAALDTDGVISLDGLDLRVADAALAGDLVYSEGPAIQSTLALAVPDLANLGRMVGIDLAGQMNGKLTLSPEPSGQAATLDADLAEIEAFGVTVAVATADITATDLFGALVLQGQIDAQTIGVAGQVIPSVSVDATGQGGATRLVVDAALMQGLQLDTVADVALTEPGVTVDLQSLTVAKGEPLLSLTAPTRLSMSGGTISLDEARFLAGEGRLALEAELGPEIDATARLDAVPVALVNPFVPNLGASGFVSGTVAVGGPRDAPEATLDLTGDDIGLAAAAAAGTVDVALTGTASTEQVAVTANVGSDEGLALDADVTFAPKTGDLSGSAQIAAFPVAYANAFVPGQGFGGTVSGSATLGGTLTDPQAEFDLTASGVSTAQFREIGISGLEASASGSFAGQTLTVAALDLRGANGLTGSASGTVPLDGSPLDLTATAQVPAIIATAVMGAGAPRFGGTISADLSVGGALTAPSLNGSVSTGNLTVFDPTTNVEISPLTAQISINNGTATINQAQARLTAGGTIDIGGSVGLTSPGIPTDLTVRFNQATYSDGQFLTTEVDGQITVTGALTSGPLIAGTINVNEAEIALANLPPGSDTLLKVQHIRPSRPVDETLRRALGDDYDRPDEGGGGVPIAFDLTVNAPARVFVRGLGLDAELGGQMSLQGTTAAPVTIGSVQLIRGRFTFGGQRIDLIEGEVRLIGDLDPEIRFVAGNRGDNVDAFVNVTGRASAPEITFTSSPPLPQDEILAQLLFGRSVNELTTFQVASIAASAASIGRGGGGGLTGGLRDATGLDDLELVTDDEGKAAVRGGTYINDNIYLEIEAGSEGRTEAIINLDITRSIRARGTVDNRGDSSIGLFFERDY
ncbi:translocation/assembly module TamB domain-containing protein [Oceanomicrobium pacificus]|uniref:Translocation and assembly module TamB C-terminal domain-containing protein n=1 Tax=Oceanomicrobium pacificus TaxID=2692916 RepID=A0A6B0TZU0_9RHOB|nr:translocation/assembly module TamB domain-containing protein [Oceanomicrobium pacificus]MXU66504.1 hypothetical protein [Oceanomicrobium pacificus]